VQSLYGRRTRYNRENYLREQIELRAESAGYDRAENARLDKMKGELRGLEWVFGIDHEPSSREQPEGEGQSAEEVYAAFKSGESLDLDDLQTSYKRHRCCRILR